MAKEYQKSTGNAQSLEEGVQQMRSELREKEEEVEEQEKKLKEHKLRLNSSNLRGTCSLNAVTFEYKHFSLPSSPHPPPPLWTQNVTSNREQWDGAVSGGNKCWGLNPSLVEYRNRCSFLALKQRNVRSWVSH